MGDEISYQGHIKWLGIERYYLWRPALNNVG